MKLRRLLGILFALLMCMTVILPSNASSQEDIFSDVQTQLEEVSEEERTVIEALFLMEQDIETLKNDELQILEAIDETNDAIKEIQERIDDTSAAYTKNKDGLATVLKTYQRMGPESFIEMILSSENLSMLLKRINTFRDLTKNTDKLIKEIKKNEEVLLEERAIKNEMLAKLQDQQLALRESINKQEQAKEEKEAYLDSLKAQRAQYEAYLFDIQEAWQALLPFFKEATKASSELLETGAFPPDALELNISFAGIKATLREDTFNQILAQKPYLEDMVFGFEDEEIVLEVPSKNLKLYGSFSIQEGHTLQFEADKGTFYGLPLQLDTINELFKEGYFVIQLEPLLFDSEIDELKVYEDTVDLMIGF